MDGHDVVIFEALEKSGGLNEYGIATYKAVDNFAQAEVDYVLAIGGIEGETLSGVVDAVDFIAELRQAEDKATSRSGRRVVVIGGGMTAIDAAVQAKLLGAEEVTIATAAARST
ncbi:pyridine nucleotide-disulfide oxidoreductase domain-containing protein [Ditylenchus destructor]|uniref:Pyridine nucleotide-disulfide oxidoreductase domain-containing protein n=1 Tax=Ditylenchus destructor TaxID=166010 RepID=A0AAD4MEJ0_9BILA|nr:pyridine nucleotide-disulfide oxidoreductase domain-containing protein [Ditylenchus destructor]